MESRIVAPAGLFPTAEERALFAGRAERRPARFEREERERHADRTRAMTVKQAFAGVRWYLREVSGESGLRPLRRAHAARPPGPAGDVAPRLRAPAAGPARGEPARALLLRVRRVS